MKDDTRLNEVEILRFYPHAVSDEFINVGMRFCGKIKMISPSDADKLFLSEEKRHVLKTFLSRVSNNEVLYGNVLRWSSGGLVEVGIDSFDSLYDSYVWWKFSYHGGS